MAKFDPDSMRPIVVGHEFPEPVYREWPKWVQRADGKCSLCGQGYTQAKGCNRVGQLNSDQVCPMEQIVRDAAEEKAFGKSAKAR